jgi:tyrosine-protein kinase Etk/Wzc
MDQKTVEAHKHVSQEIDYVKLFRILLSRWYWVLGSILITVTWAFLYLRFTPPTYQTSALLKFDDKKTEISELININSYYDRKDKIQSEIYVLQSSTLLNRAAIRLNYQYAFYRKGRVLTTETYPSKPFELVVHHVDSSSIFGFTFHIQQVDAGHYRLGYHFAGTEQSELYAYGQQVNVMGNTFSITRSNMGAGDNGEILLRFNHPAGIAGRMGGGLNVREQGKGVNIMLLTQTDKNPHLAADILNAIIQEYRLFDRDQKGLAASQTIDFINDQLVVLAKQVGDAEEQLQRFKTGNRILNIDATKTIAYENLKEFETQKNLINIKSIAIDLLEEQMRANKESLNLNFTMEGTEDIALKELVNQMNSLLNERIKRQSLYAAESGPVIEINKQIDETKRVIALNIQAARNRNNRTIQYLNQKLAEAQDELKKIPATERDLINLTRDFEINQKVYSYLLEKRLEASIARSAIMPTSNVIDPATANFGIASPNSKRIYTTAFFIGLIIGSGLILLARIINQRIFDKETVESLTNVPIIGVIRNFPGQIDKNSSQILSISNPKSIFSESVRSVRTNLSFLASELKSKIVCVTSEVSGEGKSFVVINLASTLSLIEKKVIVLDLRKSKLHHTFGLKNDLGLTNYLSNQAEIDQIIRPTHVPGLDFIPAGQLAPNPSELLYSERMRQLLAELKTRYDFILVDTAPIGLVSDSIPLIRSSDVNIFVLRSGVSTYNAASIPERVSKEFSLNNSVIVLNGFSNDSLHARIYSTNVKGGNYGSGQYYYTDYSTYGGKGYGYYSDPDQLPLLSRIRNFIVGIFGRKS